MKGGAGARSKEERWWFFFFLRTQIWRRSKGSGFESAFTLPPLSQTLRGQDHRPTTSGGASNSSRSLQI
jgi:hypothetical protein